MLFAISEFAAESCKEVVAVDTVVVPHSHIFPRYYHDYKVRTKGPWCSPKSLDAMQIAVYWRLTTKDYVLSLFFGLACYIQHCLSKIIWVQVTKNTIKGLICCVNKTSGIYVS